MSDPSNTNNNVLDNVSLSLLLDSAFEAIFTLTPDGTITSWNKGAVKMYGYTESEIIGKSISELVPSDSSAELNEILGKIRQGQKIVGHQTRRISKNGDAVDILISVIPLYGDGKIVGSTVFHEDITLQKQAERKYFELFEQASDAIFIADLNGRYTEVNSAACVMLGYSKDELIGKTIMDLIPSDDLERLEETKELILKPGVVQIAEWTLKKKDGTYLPVEVSAKILPDGRWQGFVRDISKQKEAEKKFQYIFESAPDSQIIMNSAGVITMVNKQCEETFGYKPDELIGRKIEMLVPDRGGEIHPENRRDFLIESKSRRMGSGEQLWARKKNGEEIQVDIMLSRIPLDRELLILATVRDLSEIKKLADYARNIGDTVNKLYYAYH